MDREMRRRLALEAAACAERVRAQCGVQIASPVDPVGIAEERGCEVRFQSLTSLEGIYSPEPRPTIVIGAQRPAGRRRFNCAHELGHHEFKHGMRVDQFIQGKSNQESRPEELLADMFAGFLLMSQTSVRRALNARSVQVDALTAHEAFRLASFFGVGYSTLVDHLTWSLRMLRPDQRDGLLRTQPRSLKQYFGGTPDVEVVIADAHWHGRAVDMEVGDLLVLPAEVALDDCSKFQTIGTVDGQNVYRARSRGYTRACQSTGDEWAANIRVAGKQFEGIARYRFLEDPEEEEVPCTAT